MKEQTIKNIVDTHLEKWMVIGLNKLPGQIEAEMADANHNKSEEWRIWFPIDSKATDTEIEDFETLIGYRLPNDYKTFLKHKHFYNLHISEASFFEHPVNSWQASLIENIFNGYPKEFLIDKGFVPFADWSDWGLLCFDTSKNKQNHNYPIVLWDHEMADKVEDRYNDFYDLMIKADEEDKNSRSQ